MGRRLVFFKPTCGIRQEDLLSPFLVVLVTEVLTRLIRREEELRTIHGIRIARNAPAITNM